MPAVKISDYVVAFMATVVAHAALFLLLVGLAVLELISAPSRVIAHVPPPEVMIEIRPEMFQRVSEPPAVEEPENRMVRTAAHQEADRAPEETNLIGERDTLAASELPPDPDGPMLPSQDGEKPRRPDRAETFDSQFQDGLKPDMAVTPVVDEQPPPGDPVLNPTDPVADPSVARDEAQEPPPPGGEPREELYTSNTQVPVAGREDETEREMDQDTLPKESESVSQAEESKPAGGAPESVPAKPRDPSDPAFRSEVKKTRLRGSIGRKGASSRDVANTAMGRYQAKLSRAVEREWQRNCFRYREHITPGMLTIRFLLDEKGRVSSIRFLEVMEASTIQKGFTMKSIQAADIPSMPEDIVRELDGEPLELIYNFFF